MTRPALSTILCLSLSLGLAASGCASHNVAEMPIAEQSWQQSGSNSAFLMRDLTACRDHSAIPSELVEDDDGNITVKRHGYDDGKYIACMESKGWRRDG